MEIGGWPILLVLVLALNVLNLALWLRLRRISRQRDKPDRLDHQRQAGRTSPC